MKVRASIVRKTKVDREPCTVKSVTLTRTKPIDPSQVYGMQVHEWLKELVAGVSVASLNAFEITVEAKREKNSVSKIDRALAATTRDTGGIFKAKARLIAHQDQDTDRIGIDIDWADEHARQVWENNRQSMRKANKRFRERRPDLIKHAAARNQVRQKVILKKRVS